MPRSGICICTPVDRRRAIISAENRYWPASLPIPAYCHDQPCPAGIRRSAAAYCCPCPRAGEPGGSLRYISRRRLSAAHSLAAAGGRPAHARWHTGNASGRRLLLSPGRAGRQDGDRDYLPLSAQVTTELPAGAPTARMGRRALRSGLVLAFPAAEVAGILGTTATGINSPLMRAWASRQRRPWYAPDRLNFARGSP